MNWAISQKKRGENIRINIHHAFRRPVAPSVRRWRAARTPSQAASVAKGRNQGITRCTTAPSVAPAFTAKVKLARLSVV
jgi:hypothetical protein